MALIVEYHVVADMYEVGSLDVKAGMLVGFGTGANAGKIVPAIVGSETAVIGIAGDSALSSGQTTAYSDTVLIGANSTSRYTSNRVSDFYNETAASGKITVYNGGGKFWISEDLFDGADASGVTAGQLLGLGDTNGYWETSAVTADNVVAIAAGTVSAYSSGVPGTDTTDGSITLGDYVPVILRI